MMEKIKIAVIGLGYVGLPLAVEFGKVFDVVGFDINKKRIKELGNGYDRTMEVEKSELLKADRLKYSYNTEDLKDCDHYIITVPTPIDKNKRPELTPLIKSSETVGRVLKKDDIVIYESTVFPGCTEEICVPVLEEFSGLKFNRDFYCGYSPERMNPGDKAHKVTSILKVTSGSTEEIAKKVDELYKTIVKAGTHLAPSIKVAEAAKVIENTQRDLNIAFINELSIIFNKIGIDTKDVLDAASTKWNFLKFYPGLVGGHCIGVDPYYLTHKAKELGYHPEIILSGRRMNDNMGKYVASQTIKHMIKKGKTILESNVLVLGITFKENCPDIRNTRVIDVIEELREFGCSVDVYDPWADTEEVREEYDIGLLDRKSLNISEYDAIVLTVSHKEFKEFGNKFSDEQVVFDVKSFFEKSDARL